MKRYINAEKLKAEIERQQRRVILLAHTEQASVRRDCALQNATYSYILSVIASLHQEQPEVDLEKEILDWIGDEDSCKNGKWTWAECNKMLRHFYELGLNARKEGKNGK